MKAFSFALALIFLLQSNVWATDTLAQTYNTYSQTEKVLLLKKLYTQADLAALKNYGDVSKIKLPELQTSGSEISFVFENERIVFNVKKNFVINFRNQDIDFSPGKLHFALEKLESILTKKQFSYTDLIISPSYAGAGMVLVIVIATVFGGILILNQIAMANDVVRHACKDAKNKLQEELPGLSAEGYQELETFLNEKLKELGYACKSRQAAYDLKLCDEGEVCLNELKNELKSKGKAVNNSDRGSKKESGSSSVKSQKSSTSKQ